MTTHNIRKKLGLTQKEFADKYCIPLGTVKNWDSRDCMPTYLESIFSHIISLHSIVKSLEKM